MASMFTIVAKNAIARHGSSSTFIHVTQGSYNTSTGIASVSEATETITVYKKHIKANQYFLPSLIGKDVAEFYVAGNAMTIAPKVNDKITFNSVTYTIESITEHHAGGEVGVYCLIGVKS